MNTESQNQAVSAPVEVKKPVPRIDIANQRFGILTAKEFVRTSDWNTGWRCVCDCSQERVINGYFLRSGHTTHCGCLGNETYGPEFTAAHEEKGKAFFSYQAIMTRCYNQNCKGYSKYGGRGIKVCERLQDRKSFCDFMADRPSKQHTVHRVKNDLHYSCGECDECLENGWEMNVVWATAKTQARGRSSNHVITYKGETMCMMDMAEKHGISYFVLRNRLTRDKWTVEAAIETPIEQDIPIVYKGKEYTQSGLAREKGILLSTLRGRLRKGWSVEAAVDVPLMQKGSRTGKGVLVITQMPNALVPTQA